MAAPSSMISSYGDHVPPDKNQLLVNTPYGEALLVRTSLRRFDTTTQPPSPTKTAYYELQLTEWKRAHGSHSKPATLYSTTKYPSIKPQVGHDVLCSWGGRGRIVEIRDDGILVVRLSHWRLARRSVVTCYVTPDKVQVVRHKHIYEMTVPEKIEHGQELKQEATKQFVAKNFEAALESYAKAVDAVRYVQHKSDSTNESRADLLLLMITCGNNAATCCFQTHQYDLAVNYANNALTLISALEAKKGMKIHTIMNAGGLTDMTLFGEYKIKSLIILAKACLEKKNTVEALQNLKQAHAVTQQYLTESTSSKAMQTYGKEISKLYAIAKEKRQNEKTMEKKRAKAMFATSPGEAGGSSDAATAASKQPGSPLSVSAGKPTRESASPTSVVDDGEQADVSPGSSKQRSKKRVSFSRDVKPAKEDADDAFYIGLGIVGVALVAGAAIGCTRMLLGKSRK